MADLTGHTVGSYRLVEKLGEGGMAEVYKAYQPRLDRYVAIKFIRPELVVEQGFRARFEQEAKTIARLSHSNIVHVYDFGEEGHRYYLVMEFIAGGTLKDRLQSLSDAGKIMDLDQVRLIFRQVAEALDHAHRQGVIHRDVKPANIMLTPDDRAVLNDFGLAKMVEAESGLTVTGAFTGTPSYMSPEQIEGDKSKIGPASDIYALGVVLYEMVTGRVPFTADTPLAVVLKHLHDPVPLPSTLNLELPEAVENIILKAMAKDPADRFQTAGKLGRELERALQESLLRPAGPVEPTPQPARWPKISPLRASLLAALLLIIVAGIMIAGMRLGSWLQSKGEETIATLPPGSNVAALTSPTALPGAISTPTPPPKATPTDMATDTPSPAATSTDTPTGTPTDTPSPTATPTDVPTSIPTHTPMPTRAPQFNTVGIYRTSRRANGLFVIDEVVYLANGGDGLVMLDVSAPSDPGVVGQYELGSAEDVVVAEGTAYVIAGNKLHLIDVSTPSAPRGVGEYGLDSAIWDLQNVAVSDHLVALTSHNYLELLDASDPAQPIKVWDWEPSSNSGVPCNPYIDGHTVYAACGWAGLTIFDAKDPHSPAELGRFDTPDWIIDITVVDEVAYLTLGESGLMAIDVSDPTHPTMTERYNIPAWASDVSVLGDLAYVTYDIRQGYVTEESGLIAINVKDPFNLTTIATFAEMDSATDVHAAGDLVYATDENRGVVILELASAD